MPDYCAYLLSDDGHIQGQVDLTCEDDAGAEECAKKLVDGHPVELWQLGRKIATFESKQ
jgi:hypothetical protein